MREHVLNSKNGNKDSKAEIYEANLGEDWDWICLIRVKIHAEISTAINGIREKHRQLIPNGPKCHTGCWILIYFWFDPNMNLLESRGSKTRLIVQDTRNGVCATYSLFAQFSTSFCLSLLYSVLQTLNSVECIPRFSCPLPSEWLWPRCQEIRRQKEREYRCLHPLCQVIIVAVAWLLCSQLISGDPFPTTTAPTTVL